MCASRAKRARAPRAHREPLRDTNPCANLWRPLWGLTLIKLPLHRPTTKGSSHPGAPGRQTVRVVVTAVPAVCTLHGWIFQSFVCLQPQQTSGARHVRNPGDSAIHERPKRDCQPHSAPASSRRFANQS